MDRLRLDKWLWHARFYRTRALAQTACASGKVRVNAVRTRKAHQLVGPGDILTLAQGGRIRVVRVQALADRRGDAQAAAGLYEDLVLEPSEPASPGHRLSP